MLRDDRAAGFDEQRLRALRADVDADHIIHVRLPRSVFAPIVKGNWLTHLRSLAVSLPIRVIPDAYPSMEFVRRSAVRSARRRWMCRSRDARFARRRTNYRALTLVRANTIIRSTTEQMLTSTP
jgi:hypothetical protein